MLGFRYLPPWPHGDYDPDQLRLCGLATERTDLIPMLWKGLTLLNQLAWHQLAQGREPAINFLFAFADEQLPATRLFEPIPNRL